MSLIMNDSESVNVNTYYNKFRVIKTVIQEVNSSTHVMLNYAEYVSGYVDL